MKFRTQLNRCNEDNEGYKIITHVSNFRPVKNVRGVIDFFEKISSKVKSKLKLIGEGPELEAVKDIVESKKIKNVYFLGNTQQVERELCHSDLFILPSKTESFGLSALEAMASKNVIISSNVGGLPEVNIHNHTGFLTDHNNIDQMVEFAQTILNNDRMLNDFKENAFERAVYFDIETVIKKYLSVYESVI